MKMDYLARLSTEEPTFERRIMVAETCQDPKAEATGRFAKGYQALNPTLDARRVAAIFASGWKDEGPRQFLGGVFSRVPLKDLTVGGAHVRFADACWIGGYLTCEFHLPKTRITNAGDKPVEYQARGPLTQWGGPYKLEPGRSHDFTVPYPVTIQSGLPGSLSTETVPMGNHFLLRSQEPPVAPVAASADPSLR
jgi:hypothetical protein